MKTMEVARVRRRRRTSVVCQSARWRRQTIHGGRRRGRCGFLGVMLILVVYVVDVYSFKVGLECIRMLNYYGR